MNVSQRTPATFTNAEFQKLVRSGGFGRTRVELRRGFIVKMNAQHVPHATTKDALATALKEGIARASLPWRVLQEVSVDFGAGFEPLPDVVVWDPARAPKDIDGPVPAAAVRLIVEVSDSTLADDLGAKLEDYASRGLAEYWVADIKNRLILRHAGPSGDKYARREQVHFGDAFASLAHPTLTVDTSALA